MQRMANVTKRGNSYRIKVSAGYDAAGKQLTYSTTYKPAPGMTEKQINKAVQETVRQFEEKIRNGYLANDRIRFSAFAEEWMHRHCEKHLADKTIHDYKKLLERVNAAFGHVRMCDLRPGVLQRFFDDLASARNGRAPEQALSGNTMMHYYRMLSSMLNKAVKWGYFEHNPLQRVEPPKVERKEAACLDIDEAQALLDALDRDAADAAEQEPYNFQHAQYRTMVYILLFMGLRRGEVLGLEWRDIDAESRIISIERTSEYIPQKGIITKGPKNKTSRRKITMPAQLVPLLLEYKARQSRYGVALGDQWHGTGRLFTTWNGEPMHPDTLQRWFSAFLCRYSLRHINIHGLRHTNATIAIVGAGADIPTVSRRMGHSCTTTTLNIYSHALQSSDMAAADAMDRLLSRRSG